MTDHPSAGTEKKRGRPPNQFRPGVSGNPSGRPKASRASVFAQLDIVAAERLPEIIAAVTENALAGDARAAELLFKRAWPERKGRPVPPLGEAAPDPTSGFVGMLGSVTSAMIAGDLSPEEAAAASSVIDANRKAVESAEILRRLDDIERKLQR